MLPSFGPRVTISANTGASGLRGPTSSARPSDANRRRGRPPLGPGCCASATLAQPTRKSLDGIKGRDGALRPEQLLEDVAATSLPAEVSAAAASSIPHSVSAASLSSESDLALLLGACDASQAGSSSTPLVFGSFPPVAVSLPTATDASSSAEQARTTAPDSSAAEQEEEHAAGSKAAAASTKLKADSHEFYPQAYLAAAATALAARTISSAAASRSASPASDAAAAATAEPADTAAAAAAAEQGVAVAAPDTQQQHVYASAAAEQPLADPQQQQYWAVQQQQQHAPEQWQQQQQAITPQQWHEQQQQWQQWQQQQQAQHPQMVPMPVLVPVYVQPYPYPHYVQQQHPAQMHYVMMAPPDAAAAAAAASHQAQQAAVVVHQHQQHQHQMQVCPPSPGGHSLPADTCSLMSANTPAATPTAWQHNSHYGGFSSRPGSSAGSVVSAHSSSSRRPRQHSHFAGEQAAREAGAVTVSAMSCVKDAAGALAKVVTRNGNCLLLSLVKPGDGVAQATHVAAKSLAVARFYVNAHMAAAGAAGIDAAAALTGVDSTSTSTAGAEAADAAAAAPAAAAEAAVDDEVVFMPYHRSGGGSSRAPMDTADVPLGFMVAKASARDLPVVLPPPVGIPACLQDKVQGGQQQRSPAAAGSSAGSSTATLLKAGANTDVNKLSNAVIHNILGSGHVAMQLAGAAACHVAMRSLVKARDRLLRKFNTDIVATASFANEDTSSSIGRSTVFLRLDVMASNLLQKVADAGSAVLQAVDGQQQQQQLAGATA